MTSSLLILDSRDVVVAGPDADTMWTTADPDLVASQCGPSTPCGRRRAPAVPAGQEPPLTPRMVDIAWLLADGASDRMISRTLGMSERTVSNEVREISRRLGAINRAHTIARICGTPL